MKIITEDVENRRRKTSSKRKVKGDGDASATQSEEMMPVS